MAFWLGWEICFFVTREVFFARQREKKMLVFLLEFLLVFLMFFVGVFVLFPPFFFSCVSAIFVFVFFSALP